LYEGTKKPFFKQQAEHFDKQLLPLSQQKVAFDHDLGFQIFCSYGNGYRLTKNPQYKNVILKTANVLATLYNPKVGTILSWPREVAKFQAHNTIIDNMINLELLFWASKNGGDKNLYKIAEKHALTTMKNHFRDDFTSYHVVLYDTLTGKKIKGMTHQGFADNSMWARGQAWAIYGFTMCYKETKNPKFLDFAQKVTDVYLKNLPDETLIPYWDFNTPEIPNTTRDASAACVTASALLDLSKMVKETKKAALYYVKAKKMLASLSSEQYQSRSLNDAFLLHSTGNRPINGEVDASIIYADYYYVEALLRLKNYNK
jgi:unsaturated chondroitin disaccharide hydrolase